MTPEPTGAPLRIALIGMSERMRNTLAVFFRMQCHDSCVAAAPESAQAGIADLDDQGSLEQWNAWRERYPDRPAIVLSIHPLQFAGALYVAKPVRADALLAALQQLRSSVVAAATPAAAAPSAPVPVAAPAAAPPGARSAAQAARSVTFPIAPPAPAPPRMSMAGPAATRAAQAPLPVPPPPVAPASTQSVGCGNDARSSTSDRTSAERPAARQTFGAASALARDESLQVGTLPDIDPRNAQEVAKAHYRPERFFQAVLQRALALARERSRHIGLRMPSGELVVLPDGRRVQSKLYGPNALRALCSMPLREDEIPLQVLPADYLLDDPAVFPVLNAESLLWQSALFSARGRLPEGTPLDEPVVMRCWPNMTRMALFPHAMRIAAVWADGPRSLLETARLLRIPQRHVFAFYSASHALGYAQAGSGAAAGEPAVQRAAGQATRSGPARAARPERTSLFQRILERLRLGAVT